MLLQVFEIRGRKGVSAGRMEWVRGRRGLVGGGASERDTLPDLIQFDAEVYAGLIWVVVMVERESCG